MKNLANCKPSEFLVQTNRIRKSVEKWLEVTNVMNIRKTKPVFADGMSEEDCQAAIQKQIKTNLSKMFDSMLEKNAKDTLELLALVCFVEPENVDDHPMNEYIDALNELLSDKAVLGFFTSLVKLGQMNI